MRNFYDRELEQRLSQRQTARKELMERLRAMAPRVPQHSARLDANGLCIYDGLTLAAHALPVEPAKDGEVHTSVMIALYPSAEVAQQLALEGGEHVDELHVTLAFLGKANEIKERHAELAALVQQFAAAHAPLTGEVSGLGLFTAGPQPVTYASVDVPGLPHFRQELVNALEAAGFPVSKNHGYTPHMTLAYADRRDHNPANLGLEFPSVTIAFGGQRTTFPLTGVESARTKTKGEKPHKYSHPAGPNTLLDESKFAPPCADCSLPYDDLVHQAMGDADSVPTDVDDDGTPDNDKIGATLRPFGAAADTEMDAAKTMQGIDAGIDQALVLLRSCREDQMPEYALQARDLLQAIEEACDTMLAYFGVKDADEPGDPEEAYAGPVDGQKVDTDKKLISVNEPAPTAAAPVLGEPVDPDTKPVLGQPVQRAFVSEINGHTFITGPADLVIDGWEKALTPNQHVKWMQGRFVGGEKANRNGAFWSTQDLEFGQPTVQHGPLNWLHEARHIIGTIADAKLVLPSGETAAEALGVVNEPHINALSAIWQWIYPDECYVIEQASDAGKLWYSMECVSRTVQCVGEGSCGTEAAYMDYLQHKGVCQHMKEHSATRRLVDPTFLGGAVIVPPVRPGWADADARFMREASKMAEASFETANPEMTASEWELLMAQLVRFARS